MRVLGHSMTKPKNREDALRDGLCEAHPTCRCARWETPTDGKNEKERTAFPDSD